MNGSNFSRGSTFQQLRQRILKDGLETPPLVFSHPLVHHTSVCSAGWTMNFLGCGLSLSLCLYNV